MQELPKCIVALYGSKLQGSKKNCVYRNTILDILENGSIKTEAPNTLLGETLPISKTISLEEKDDGFLLLHAKRSKDEFYEMRIWETNFKIEDEEKRRKIIDFLQRKISEQREERPKKLMVLINPASGWGRGPKIYSSRVAPVFAAAAVEAKVIVSKSREDVNDIIMANDLKDYDGLLVGGGDGSVVQILNALVKKSNADETLDREDPNLNKFDVAIGILPFGSGNATAILMSRSLDVTTIAINFVLGFKRKMDLMTIHDLDRGFKFVTSSHYFSGFMALMNESVKVDRHRYLGPLRYLLIFASCIRGLPNVNVEKIETRSPQGEEMTGRRGCVVYENEDGVVACDICAAPTPPVGAWTPLPAKFLGAKGLAMAMNLRAANMANCEDPRFVDLHLSDGVCAVFTECQRSFWSWYKMLNVWYPNYGESRMSREPQLCKHLCSEMKIELDDDSDGLYIMADGENFHVAKKIYVKVHRGVMDVFGTGEIEGHSNVTRGFTKHHLRGALIGLPIVLLLFFILLLIGIAFFIKFLIFL